MKRAIQVLNSLLLAASLAGCATSPTFLKPHSLVAAREANLYAVILYMALGVFLLVELLLVYNILRFRRRKNQEGEPVQKYGNWRLEFTWTAIPVLLVISLFVMTVQTIGAVAPPQDSPAEVSLAINVIGHQWWWEFDYPELGVKTANELHVPVGANVQLIMTSVDVIHSFWVPQLSGKIDVIPGQVNHLWFRADEPGEYVGQCAEFCGLNHANMRIKVVAQTQAEYAAWADGQQQVVYQPVTDQEQKAYNIITKGICATCHTLGDNKATNEIGPNLTHLMSRSVFAGGIFELNEENLRKWLENTQAMKPGNDMNITVSKDDINVLVPYLLKLK